MLLYINAKQVNSLISKNNGELYENFFDKEKKICVKQKNIKLRVSSPLSQKFECKSKEIEKLFKFSIQFQSSTPSEHLQRFKIRVVYRSLFCRKNKRQFRQNRIEFIFFFFFYFLFDERTYEICLNLKFIVGIDI